MTPDTPRPTYAERRPAQIAAGAPPIPPKPNRLRTGQIRVSWTPCRSGDENLKSGKKPTWFRTEAKAHQANDRLASERGYRELVVHCDICKGFHLQHVFASDLQKNPMLTMTLDELLTPQAAIPIIEAAIAQRAAQQDAPQAPIPAPCGEARAPVAPQDPPNAPAAVKEPTFETWLEAARILAKTGKCLNWDIGDHINFGKRIYGDSATRSVREATRWTRGFVTRVASICQRFPAEQRRPEVSFDVHKVLAPFPPEIANKLLALAAEKNIGARRIYKMAVDMSGKRREHYRRENLSLPADLYEKLRERAQGGKVAKLVQEIIESWLVGAPVERKPSGPRTQEWKERVLAS